MWPRFGGVGVVTFAGHSSDLLAGHAYNVVARRIPRDRRQRAMSRSRPLRPDRSRTAGEELARAVAGAGLGSRLPLPDEPVPDPDFEELLGIVGHHRLVGALAELAHAGSFPVTERQLQSLTSHHTDWVRLAIEVERVLLRVDECFSDGGIDFRVLKGAALSHLVYDDPSWRIFTDLDLLVRSDQFDEAVRLARSELGGRQVVPELRPGFDREFGKEALIQVGRVELDIHRTFVSGPFGLTIGLDELFGSETPFEVGGRVLPALGALPLFMHACYNLALGDYPVRLCAMRDLLAIRARSNLDTDAITALAHSWRCTGVVQRAAQLTVDTVGLDSSHSLSGLAQLTTPSREQWLLRSYFSPARSYTRPLASLAVIRGTGARYRYAKALLAPSGEYLRSRGWTERSHLRRACDRLLRRG